MLFCGSVLCYCLTIEEKGLWESLILTTAYVQIVEWMFFLEVGADVCPVCGKSGCLIDIEQNVDQLELVERLQEEGWDWYEHMLDVYGKCSRLDNFCLDEIGAMWENLKTDEENIQFIVDNYRKDESFYK